MLEEWDPQLHRRNSNARVIWTSFSNAEHACCLLINYFPVYLSIYLFADPIGRACWVCGFESRRGYVCLSRVSVCVVR